MLLKTSWTTPKLHKIYCELHYDKSGTALLSIYTQANPNFLLILFWPVLQEIISYFQQRKTFSFGPFQDFPILG